MYAAHIRAAKHKVWLRFCFYVIYLGIAEKNAAPIKPFVAKFHP